MDRMEINLKEHIVHKLSFINTRVRIFGKREKKEEIWLRLMTKPLHQQKCQKGKVTTQTMQQKSSITQRLRANLGRSVGSN